MNAYAVEFFIPGGKTGDHFTSWVVIADSFGEAEAKVFDAHENADIRTIKNLGAAH